MLLNEMIELLNLDLANERLHLAFYLNNASMLTGLHAHEYKELFVAAAESEMKHVLAFQDLIVGLGGKPSCHVVIPELFPDVVDALKEALRLEEMVVANYIQRQKQAQLLSLADPINGGWIDVFLDSQIQDSRQDADHYRQILRGCPKPARDPNV